jgi:hypothetical protein
LWLAVGRDLAVARWTTASTDGNSQDLGDKQGTT